MKALYLVLNITEWSEVSAEVFGNKFPVNIPESGDAFAPIYYDYKKAKRDYPNSRIIEMTMETEKQNEQA
jgi:hypothetical protein